jgi:hypothetical protein
VGARINAGALTIFNLELFYRTIILKTSKLAQKQTQSPMKSNRRSRNKYSQLYPPVF